MSSVLVRQVTDALAGHVEAVVAHGRYTEFATILSCRARMAVKVVFDADGYALYFSRAAIRSRVREVAVSASSPGTLRLSCRL